MNEYKLPPDILTELETTQCSTIEDAQILMELRDVNAEPECDTLFPLYMMY